MLGVLQKHTNLIEQAFMKDASLIAAVDKVNILLFRERERERERESVCVCVCEKERERESVYVHVYMYVCM